MLLSELEELVDDVVFLLDGEVAFQGTLRQLKKRRERAASSGPSPG